MTAPKATPESTASLLRQANAGDRAARERLFKLFLPVLTRWAHGRLPAITRDLTDTADVVQLTLISALHRLDDFEARGPGAFLAYLRQILRNQIHSEIEKLNRRQQLLQAAGPAPDDLPPSALEQAIGREQLDKYHSALARLSDKSREAVILRLEMDLSYAEIADLLDFSSANSARMSVTRALEQLAQWIDPR